MIKSDQEAQRDYLLSFAYSVMTLLPVVDVIAPEVGIPLNIGVSTELFGLSLEGKESQSFLTFERAS